MRTAHRHSAGIFLAVAGAAALGACNRSSRAKTAQDNGDLSQVVAKVDDTVITVGEVQERINKQSPFIRARYTTVDKKKEFLDNLIRFEVMAHEAQRRGYDKDPEVVRVAKQQMISKFLQKDFESKLKVEDVPDADVEKYYREHPEEFNKKDEVRVSEILVKDKAKADKAYAEAKALPKNATTPAPAMGGTSEKTFRDLVTKYSEDEDSKQRGGDLTFFDRDSTVYPRPVVEAAFKLGEVGDVSAPVKTDKGWVVLKLTQKRPGFNRPLAEVKRQIQQRLFRDTRTKALDNFVADMKKKTNIEVHDENLAKVVIETGAEGGGMPGMGMPGPGMSGMPPGMGAPAMGTHAGGPMGAMGAGAPPPGMPAPRSVPQGKP
jgi:peptidyl-prolyl cis-trans isomerase C